MSNRLAVTFGDPCSIGPEVGIKALKIFLQETPQASLSLFACLDSLSMDEKDFLKSRPQVALNNISSNERLQAGKPSSQSGKAAVDCLRAAAQECLEDRAKALVTGPVDKYFCSLTQKDFRGQTEFLRDLSESKGVTMLLAHDRMRVALVTTHLALRDVPSRLTTESIVETCLRSFEYLKSLTPKPKIAILALNPHASDQGLFGNEEKQIIEPAIQKLKALGMDVTGPLPSDTAFAIGNYDAHICMYHDQALIPIKLTGFYEAINLSLGLPFLRASVDHGTAFDIAGQNKANATSFLNALRAAYRWANPSGL